MQFQEFMHEINSVYVMCLIGTFDLNLKKIHILIAVFTISLFILKLFIIISYIFWNFWIQGNLKQE